MAKIAAIEFDDQIARVVLARSSATGFQLQSAFEVELESSLEEDSAAFAKSLSGALGNRLGRCEALVSFGRGQSELRVINVPVVPDNELPDIVRFQAMRQFSNCTDDSPVDFLTLSEGNDEKQVLAATVSSDVIKKLRDGFQQAGLQLKGVKLRGSCSTALCQAITNEHKNYIILDPAAKSFNLEVVAFGNLCLTRTVRAVSSEHGQSKQIVREIRRTLAAANNQIPDYETSRVVVFGHESDFPGLLDEIQNDLQFDCEFIDPFQQMSGLTETPERVGTYASLIGLLTDHGSKKTETIDFLNPRKKTSSTDGRNVKMLLGIAAAVLVVGVFLLSYLVLNGIHNKTVQVNKEIKELTSDDKFAEELIGDVNKIEDFDTNQVVWLRSLANFSEDFPLPDHAIMNSMTFATKKSNQGSEANISFSGFVDGIASRTAIEETIRNEKHQVVIDKTVRLSDEREDTGHYTHVFSGRVFHPAEVDDPEVDEEELEAFLKKHRVEPKGDEANEKQEKKEAGA